MLAPLARLRMGPGQRGPSKGTRRASSCVDGEDLCSKEHIGPGKFEKAVIDLNAIRSHLGYGPETIRGQLRCAPLLEIWPHSAGPWQPSSPWTEGPGWLSIRCDRYDEQTHRFDHGLEPIDGGAGYYVSPDVQTTQVSGGFGSGNDGYWHAVAVSAVLTLAVAASASVARPLAGQWKGESADGTSVSFHVVHDDAFGVSHTRLQDIHIGGHLAYQGTFVHGNNHFEVCKVTQLQSHAAHACFEGHFESAHEAIGARRTFLTAPNGSRIGTDKTYPWTARLVGQGASATVADQTDVVNYSVHSDGGFGQIAGNHDLNICRANGVEPGGQRRAVIGSADHRVLRGTFLCAPRLEIWGHTAGPWDPDAPGGPGWLSIRCPAGERPVHGGAGFSASPHRHLTQVSGGFGSGNDGFWHYRFHNWTAETVTIQFWGVCEKG